MAAALLYVLLLLVVTHYVDSQRCDIIETKRINCHPDGPPNEEKCLERRCCFLQAVNNGGYNNDVPWCFYPAEYSTYMVSDFKKTSFGYRAALNVTHYYKLVKWQPTINYLSLEVHHFPQSQFVRLKIFDPAKDRYQVPGEYPATGTKEAVASPKDFPTKVHGNGKGIIVSDKHGRVLFNSAIAPLIFSDQFIQISTLAESSFAYGFGESQDVFAKPVNTWRKYTLFVRSSGDFVDKRAPGVHPFVLFMRPDATSFGYFLLNSNAMDIELTPYPALTFRTIGGIIDLFIYAGATPDAVVKQHLKVVGLPLMPPYWALGLHLNSLACNSKDMVETYMHSLVKSTILFDTILFNAVQRIGGDHLYWAFGKVVDTWLQRFKDSQKVVHFTNTDIANVITDLGHNAYIRTRYWGNHVFIRNGETAFQALIKLNGDDTDRFVNVSIPDFTEVNTQHWWYGQAVELQIDYHNITGFYLQNDLDYSNSSLQCGSNNLEMPPFKPGLEQTARLSQNTVCMSANQTAGRHYDLHSLYGHHHAKVVYEQLEVVNLYLRDGNKVLLPFVITKSSFAGTGKYAHHWINDLDVEWENSNILISDMLNYNLFGMPFVGVDLGATSEVLHTRWNQLFAFTPFVFYNEGCKPSTPISNTFLPERNKLLPYFYTLLWRASTYAETVLRPVFWNYPKDSNTWAINNQFMIGSALLVPPVPLGNASEVMAYIPRGLWYRPGGERLLQNGRVLLNVELDQTPIFIRGGYILPMQLPMSTTEQSRKNPFYIVVALNESKSAEGELYMDDGLTLDKRYMHVQFKATAGKFSSIPTDTNYSLASPLSTKVDLLKVYGISKPLLVTVNGVKSNFTYEVSTAVLEVPVSENFSTAFYVEWRLKSSSAGLLTQPALLCMVLVLLAFHYLFAY